MLGQTRICALTPTGMEPPQHTPVGHEGATGGGDAPALWDSGAAGEKT